MKKISKILLFVIAFAFMFGLASCFGSVDEVDSIEFKTQPKTVFVRNSSIDPFDVIVTVNKTPTTYTISYSDGTVIVKVGDVVVDAASYGFTFKGFNLSTLGTYTAVIKFAKGSSSASISFTYQVVDSDYVPLFSGGDGTATNPYLISTVGDLLFIGTLKQDDKHYKLMNDIDLTGISWIPIGQKLEHAFSGTIDGNGHTISGLSNIGYNYSSLEAFTSAAGSTGYPFALIGYAKGNIAIKNLTINVNIDFDHGVGNAAFVGIYENQEVEASTIEFINCTVNGSIKAKDKVGGFIGSTYKTGSKSPIQHIIFDNCINNAEIEATTKGIQDQGRAGGFIGTWVEKSGQGSLIFIECENNGSITGGYYQADEDADRELYYGAVIGFIAGANRLGTESNPIDLSGVSNSIDDLNKIGHDDWTTGTKVIGLDD